jgi:pilus assembly protein CpaC
MLVNQNMSIKGLSAILGLAIGIATGSHAIAQTKVAKAPTVSPIEVNGTASSRIIKIARDKARIIELPVDVADVLIANAAIADVVVKTPRRIYLLGRTNGSTNAFFFDAAGNEVLRAEIEVGSDLAGLITDSLDELIPNHSISAIAVGDRIFLQGTARSPDIAEWARVIAVTHHGTEANIMNMISIVEDQQVLLQVRVAEASRTVLKQFGINLFNAITGAINTLTSGDLVVSAIAGTIGSSYGRLALQYTNSSGDTLALTINALENNGLLKILAEPNLTAISGETASFLAGGEFPIPVSTGDDAVSVEFREFGVQLNFTPIVLSSGRISLRIATEISEISNRGGIIVDNFAIPGRSIRRAESTVELPSGGSMMMAGLISRTTNTTVEGVPGLKDVPFLGALFRQNQTDINDTEMIVVVTASLVKPIEKKSDISSPFGTINPPSDYDLYALGRIQSRFGVPGNNSLARDLKGPIGYILQ